MDPDPDLLVSYGSGNPDPHQNVTDPQQCFFTLGLLDPDPRPTGTDPVPEDLSRPPYSGLPESYGSVSCCRIRMDPYHLAGSAWMCIMLPDPHRSVLSCRICMDPHHLAGSA